MNATVTELYRENDKLPSLNRVEGEALEWESDYHGKHFEINSWVRNKHEDKVLQYRNWLYAPDNIVLTGRPAVQRLAMRAFDKLMAQGQPDGEDEPLPVDPSDCRDDLDDQVLAEAYGMPPDLGAQN